MDYGKLIKKYKKYHFLYVGKKTMLLASNNDLQEAQEKTVKKLKSKLSFFEGKDIVRLKFIKVDSDLLKRHKKSKLKVIGGPIKIEINVLKINSNGNLKKDDKETRHDNLFITDRFIEDEDELKGTHLKKIAKKTIQRKLRKTFASINTIDKL